MENQLRTIVLDWLASGPAPLDLLNTVEQENPLRASLPWLGIAASASTDWSTKTRTGREIRIAIEVHSRTDPALPAASLAAAVEQRLATLPREQAEFHIVTIQFLRARAERRIKSVRSTLLEYRFRCLANQPE